jgi:uncharacterized protein (DUF362 family)
MAGLNRRDMIRAGVSALAGSSVFASRAALSEQPSSHVAPASLVARPPSGFVPFRSPGLVTKVAAKGDYASMMQPNQLWPKPEIARALLERAMTDLTGASNLVESMKRLIHPADTVAVKVNGISGQVGHTVAVNFELILPVVETLLAVGVPANRITVYEQYPTYLMGTRVNVREWQLPQGVQTGTHNNRDMAMSELQIFENVPTRYCRFFTEATAVIDMTMMKHHSICGFTGAMKNITHGNIDNPHKHHEHQAGPQIALLYSHPIVQSRVRLHITDAFKLIYDKGPLDKDPRMRFPHGAVYASTDAVALDTVGERVIDEARLERGGMTLERAGRTPTYIERAANLGVGIHDWNDIRLRSVTI